MKIIRIFDGRASVHVVAPRDDVKAMTRCDSFARKAKAMGRNVSVSLRELHPASTTIGDVLNALEERGVYNVSSYGGRREGESGPETIRP